MFPIKGKGGSTFCHTGLHLGYPAELRIWQVSACKMELRLALFSGLDHPPCHSCWMESRIKEVTPDLAVNQAGISRYIDLVKAIADSDVIIEEHE